MGKARVNLIILVLDSAYNFSRACDIQEGQTSYCGGALNKVSITISDLSKVYRLYGRKIDRLKEALSPIGKKYHRPFSALTDINLSVKEGEILGIVGLNGSGKSTLLKLISGVLQPSVGTVSVQGRVTALLELGAGFNPEFTGEENIRFYSHVLGMSDVELLEKYQGIVDFADIGEHLDQPLRTYSSGMKSRLAFAVACHVNSQVLILDEVLAVGDVKFRRKCYAKMDELFNAGITILFVSHDSNSVNKLCTRAIHLHKGKIINDGAPKEVTKQYEKLVLSSIASQEKIANQIALGRSAINPKAEMAITSPKVSDEREWYSPELANVDTVSYPSLGVEIRDSRIVDMDGRQINVLVHGKKYAYKYTVVVHQDVYAMSFGMQVKDEQGMFLTGAATHHENRVVEFSHEGDIYDLEWVFECNLLEGIYYTNSGVSRRVEGGREFIAREVDVYCFKVMDAEPHGSKGIFSLGQESSISKRSDSSAEPMKAPQRPPSPAY